MCWEIDYKFLVEQKKAQDDAYQQDNETKVEGTPAKEVAPAK